MIPGPLVIGRYNWAKWRGGGSVRRDLHRLAVATRSTRAMRAAGNVRGLPQVVFKVAANGGCLGVKGLAAQLDYVLGKADHVIDPLKQHDRAARLPAEATGALARDWAEGWERRVRTGHSMHMIASFPRGTDPEKVAEIIRETCHDLLDQGRGRFGHIAAVHTDKGHPHAHVVVDRRNAEGEWFHFARDGEFTYDRFKDTIVEHAAAWGIELVNSSRLSRGLTGEAVADPAVARRGLAGSLVAHGPAPYRNRPNARASYHVTLATPNGEKTLWGRDLGPVLAASGATVGQAIRITHEGKEAVQVRTRDGVLLDVHRNRWAVEVPGRETERSSARPEGQAEATEAQAAGAEGKRGRVRTFAADYLALAAAYAPEFPALARAFRAAGERLESGLALIGAGPEQRRTSDMPDSITLDAEAARALATIEEARDELLVAREAIPRLRPAERPEVEARYFEALRDVERLLSGTVRPEFGDPARGSIYAEGGGAGIADLDRGRLGRSLEGTGIDAEEVAARAAVGVRTAALEAHWVGRRTPAPSRPCAATT
ncbi:relaxase/mobilization nuclease domain-containing protein [Cereibacter sphaeroides]|uniref:relaxase/mobilization nuclease domain-containing protein n=1 Tax=Cereibacter sphaeroides TaxID=1063 RepID=UPI001F3A12FE|nr:relaxase/mobilization nuclease domain-containing protein [Cereibacter sphaeroides]MCE6958039.1 relaxase/mobilization nuclease domain-containing protein [Cereibacter sphaeroides]MCE6971974.1 relaxase/mobilization nuclease domain-containing protein [Cereibacter sphaeroides]